MTDPDDLLTKADALLARWRSGNAAPQPPADYPVLNDVVDVPALQGAIPLPQVPFEAPMAKSTAVSVAGPTEAAELTLITDLYAPEEAAVALSGAGAPTLVWPQPIQFTDDFPVLAPNKEEKAPTDATLRELEDRVYLRVLDAIEPYVSAFIEEPLRLRLDELALEIATAIARDARSDIMTLVRDAVRSAVAHELEARGAEGSD